MSIQKSYVLGIVCLAFLGVCLLLISEPAAAQNLSAPIYISPLPNAKFVSPGTTIAVRFREIVSSAALNDIRVQVTGTKSGAHRGSVILAQDKKTVIFKPAQSFTAGEEVHVAISAGSGLFSGRPLMTPLAYSFSVSPAAARPAPASSDARVMQEYARGMPPRSAPLTRTRAPQYVTLPGDFPGISVTTPASGTAEGYIFTAPFYLSNFVAQFTYLTILDNNGQPVYYSQQPGLATDFKVQPNGLLTYYDANAFHVMDSAYNIVDTIQAGNGYTNTDLHELLLTNDGHALFLIYDSHTEDLSQIVTDGNPATEVIGLIIQELDAAKNVVFEWRSWDHFSLTDTYDPLPTSDINPAVLDYVHGNAIEIDHDGNLLLSSRNMSEITKIYTQTGDILWRLGGKNNQFTFANITGTYPYFGYQHDIRRLPNNNITIFDNRDYLDPIFSRAEEYQTDEISKVVTLTWSYQNDPNIYAFAMGDARRLSNGNTVIGWGFAPVVTEVRPDGSKAFELTYADPFISYRAFRLPWHGYPTAPPQLVRTSDGGGKHLIVSWNGATDIASYKIFGGVGPSPKNLVATISKTGFETTYDLSPDSPYCMYRVMPVDLLGADTLYSNDASFCTFNQFLPFILK